MSQGEKEGDQNGPLPRYPGWCSFCRKSYRDVGPLIEGPDLVFICYGCTQACSRLIEGECRRLGVALPETVGGRILPFSRPSQ
jgi:ATP-dependent Clp protease ATP-binding subunit ClpX